MRHDWNRGDGLNQLLRLSDVGLEHTDDLTAEARITFTHSQTRRSATASILYARPDLFRIDVRGPLFSHILTAVAWGDSIAVLSDGQAWSGNLSDGILAELTDFDVGPYDIRYALLGLVRPGRVREDGEIVYPRADRAVAELSGENGVRRRVWVDLHRGFVSREEVGWEGGDGWSRDLRDYRQVGSDNESLYLPSRIDIRQGDIEIDLHYRSYAVNSGLGKSTFFRGIPPSMVSDPWIEPGVEHVDEQVDENEQRGQKNDAALNGAEVPR